MNSILENISKLAHIEKHLRENSADIGIFYIYI